MSTGFNICSLFILGLLVLSHVTSMPNKRSAKQQAFPVAIKVLDGRPYKYGRLLNVECMVAATEEVFEMKWTRESTLTRATYHESYNKILMEIKSNIILKVLNPY